MKYYLEQQADLLYEKGLFLTEDEEEAYTFEADRVMLPEIYLYQNGFEIGHVATKLSLLIRKYDLYIGDELIDTVEEEPQLFRSKLVMENLGYQIRGDIWNLNFEIINESDEIVCEVQEEMWHLMKNFSVDIFDEENEILLLLIVLAIFRFTNDSDDTNTTVMSSLF